MKSIQHTNKAIAKSRNILDLDKYMEKQNKILFNWFVRNYGEKCPDFCFGCPICEKWLRFEELKYPELKSELEKMK